MCFALFYGGFCMHLYSVNSDEALNASSLQFFSSDKCFIADLKEIHRLTLHRRYFL
jgi:hypothetical protein